ncbi:hypothetical protein [Sphingobium chungangianum]
MILPRLAINGRTKEPMPSPTIDFRVIRPHHGSQHGGFEELTCQLAALENPSNAPFHRKGAGADAGLECYRVEANGSETGWQAKYFFALGSGEASQLTDSFTRAIDRHPRLAHFIVCLPFNLSDGRIDGRTSERDRWDAWVEARTSAIFPRVVTIELWDETQLIERLSRTDPRHAGRRQYWFDTLHFAPQWFRTRFQITRETLGKRYTPELNIELPVRNGLLAIARDPAFIDGLRRLADNIDEARHRATDCIDRLLAAGPASASGAALDTQLRAISTLVRSTELGPTDAVPFDTWGQAIDQAIATLGVCAAAIWNLRGQPGGDREEIRRAHDYADRLYEALGALSKSIKAPISHLANARRLLLTGDAGVGKSHLLADVADHHITQGFPAVLVLGGGFVEGEPWRQVADQLGLTNATPDVILGALDAAGEAAGTRALVVIDAINERGGIGIWSSRLASFLATANRFSHVAVVLSCRTTFLPFIVRELDETALPRLAHPGFAGRAAEAAQRYLDHRGIVRMAAPNFSPEFENPLFLRTCCDALERRGEQELPRGLVGVSGVFDFYFEAIAEAITSRMGLFPRLQIVERALAKLTEAMVDARSGYLPVAEVLELLQGLHPSQNQTEQSLFFQLENEGVLTVEPVIEGAATTEMVRFTFERLSDHRIAQALLDATITNGDPRSAFSPDGALLAYVTGQNASRFAGIAEAFAVQLPERFGVELMELIDDDFTLYNLLPGFRASLLWRRPEAFSAQTIQMLERFADYVEGDLWLETMIAIATEPSNPFNADHLDAWLRPLSLPERDELWSVRATYLTQEDDNVIETLVRWVLANGLNVLDPERARLAGMTLAWLTSLSHRVVRDMATKALAVLLVSRRALAAYLIERFAEVNDAYVVDRVLAAAYGAATRSHCNSGLATLAEAAYAAVFAKNPIPVHALIRDHALGIIELAAHRGALPSSVPLDRARPPYPAGPPLELIDDEVIGSFVQDYGGTSLRDDIRSSTVEDGDFARYEVDPLAQKFLELPRNEVGRAIEVRYDEWYARVVAPHPERETSLQRVIDLSGQLSSIPHDDFSRWLDDAADDNDVEEGTPNRKDIERERGVASSAFKALLNDAERHDYEIYAQGWVEHVMWDAEASARHPNYNGLKARRWIAWRAHDLGWTSERFANFERHMPSRGSMEHRVERIGKKYQWIAYHELTGRLSDLVAVDGGFNEEPQPYRGPWQVDTREMDPTILVTRTEQRDTSRQPATWWSPHAPRWREDPPQARLAWMRDESLDIPNPTAQLDVADLDGRRWLVLEMGATRNQSVMDEGERVFIRMTWHKIHSLLVPRGNADHLIRHLSRSERDRDHLPKIELPWWAYLGEYPWHSVYDNLRGEWHIGRPEIEVFGTIADRYVERSGHNYSIEESFNLTIPGPRLMRGLDLRLAEGHSLSYCDAQGQVLFKDPSSETAGHSAAVVDRTALSALLARDDLELVWVFTGEKSAHGGRPHRRGWGGHLEYWGIYRFDGSAISGQFHFEHKEPNADQLAEFLAHR